MARSGVRLNSRGVQDVLNAAATRSALRGPAQNALSAALSGVPRDSGELAASGHLEDATTDRAVVRVVFDAPHALAVEARTGFLSRALDAAR